NFDIFDIYGNKSLEKRINLPKSNSVFKIDVTGLPQGAYLLKAHSDYNNSWHERFLIIR
ncbi:MAG: hypothetical protein QG635_130, partial [Bacteroidota bacterium]|nr:hypothetical protein [Bacteroidota bacterium]